MESVTATASLAVVMSTDDRVIGELVAHLAFGGFDVVEVRSDGSGSVAVVRSLSPGSVVVDLDEADVDMGVIAALRRAVPSARLVAWSSFADPYTLADALSAGADGYVDKADGPVAVADLLTRLRAVGGDRRPPGAGRDGAAFAVDELVTVRGELARLRDGGVRSHDDAARYEALADRAAALVAAQWAAGPGPSPSV